MNGTGSDGVVGEVVLLAPAPPAVVVFVPEPDPESPEPEPVSVTSLMLAQARRVVSLRWITIERLPKKAPMPSLVDA